MARSWLKYVAIAASLALGTVCSTALADNKFSGGGFRVSGGSSPGGGGSSRGSINRGSASPRPSGNFGGNSGGGFRPPVSRVGGGNLGSQVITKPGGPVLTKPTVPSTPKPPVVTAPKFPVPGKLPSGGVGIGGGAGNSGGSGGIKINPIPIVGGNKTGGIKINPIGGIADKIGGPGIKPIGGKLGDGKLGGITIGPKLPIGPGPGPAIGPKGPGIVAGGCYPGGNAYCTPCNPFKPGCHPWWFCPSWVAPAVAPCYPVVYTEPIIVPVSVPAAPIVVPVSTEVPPPAPAETATPAVSETVKPASTAPEEKLLQVPLGATLTLQAKELGEQAGQVILQIEKIAMPALVSDWTIDSVTATLPTVGIAENLRAELLLVKADGQIASSVKVELTPPLPPAAEETKLAGDPTSAASLLPASLNP